MRKTISLFLPLIGLVIFVLIIRGIGVGRIIDTFRVIDPPKLLVFPLFTVFILFMRGYRWWYLMRLVGIEYSLRRSTSVWTIGFFGAAVTPGKVGDAVRAYYLSRDTGRNLGECFLTVFIDRLMDLVTVLIFGVLAMFIFSYFYIEIPSIWIVVGIAGVLILFLTVLLQRGMMRRILRPLFNLLVPTKHKESLSAGFNTFYDSLGFYITHWKSTLVAYLLTLLFWAGVMLLAVADAWVLEIDVPAYYIFLIMPMVTLVELIPISTSGLGTREAAVIFFFSVINVGSAEAVGLSIAYLLTGTYVTAAIGFIAWLRHPVKLRE